LNAENAGRLEQPSSKVLVERSKVLLERSNARRDARPVEQPASAKDVEAFVEELRDALVDTKRVAMRHVAGLRGLGGQGVFDFPWDFLMLEFGGQLTSSPSF
jgi:hypothetical protein